MTNNKVFADLRQGAARVGNGKRPLPTLRKRKPPMPQRSALSILGALMLSFVAAAPAGAQDAVTQFYKGRQINLYVGSSAGGGYDTYARLLARRFGNAIAGNPAVVVQNMPGAGSNKLAAYIYSVAPRDGTAIGAIFSGAILQPLLGDPVQHDPSKFIYLGNANNEAFLCLARTDAPVKTFRDALSRELILGATNEGGSTRDFAAMLDNLLGAKLRIVTGYPGSNEILLALERNEVQGACGLGWSSVAPQRARLLDSGLIRIILQLANSGHPEMDRMGVPLAAEFARSDDDRQAMELVFSQLVFGRPFILPPGVPAERVAALRRAFMAALTDKETVAEARAMQLDLDPLSGEAVQQEVAKAYATPARIVERARQSLIYKP
jgi:tripartite-type tricarboxylate transporter receptor subunit TctC